MYGLRPGFIYRFQVPYRLSNRCFNHEGNVWTITDFCTHESSRALLHTWAPISRLHDKDKLSGRDLAIEKQMCGRCSQGI